MKEGEEGRKGGREEGRKGGREEGRKGGREEGRKGGREEGRKGEAQGELLVINFKTRCTGLPAGSDCNFEGQCGYGLYCNGSTCQPFLPEVRQGEHRGRGRVLREMEEDTKDDII